MGSDKNEDWEFQVPYHPRELGTLVSVQAHFDQYMFVRSTRLLLEFLLHVDDFDLLTRLCKDAKEKPGKDDEKEREELWGVGPLYNALCGMLSYQMTNTEYQGWLDHVLREVQRYLVGNTFPYDRMYSSFSYDTTFVRGKHSYPLVIYALFLLPLGRATLDLVDAFLYEAKRYDPECPGLAFAYNQRTSYAFLLMRDQF